MTNSVTRPRLPGKVFGGRNAVAWLVWIWLVGTISGWIAIAGEGQREDFVVPLNGVEMVWERKASVPDGGYWRSKEPFEPEVRDIEAYCRLLTFNCLNRPFDFPDYFGFAYEEGHLVARSGLARPLVTRNSSAERRSESPAPAANPVPSDAAKIPPPPVRPVSAVAAVERPAQERQAATPSGEVSSSANDSPMPAESAVVMPPGGQLPKEKTSVGSGVSESAGTPLRNGLVPDFSPPSPVVNSNPQSSRGNSSAAIPSKVQQRYVRPLRPANVVHVQEPVAKTKEISSPTPGVKSGQAGENRGGIYNGVSRPQMEKKDATGGPFSAIGKAFKGGGDAIKSVGSFVGGAFATKEERQQRKQEKQQQKQDKKLQEKMPKVNEVTERVKAFDYQKSR